MRLDPLPDDVAATLNPGIRRTVAWLRERGFDTCDSGDGATHDHVCDRPYVYVTIRCAPADLVVEAHRLAELLRAVGVPIVPQGEAFDENGRACAVGVVASYDPVDGFALIDLVGLDDAQLPP